MPRVLAIDYGRKRCGVAVTDTLKICANPLPTQRACDLLDFIADYCSRESVERIIVGLPLTLKGDPSESSRYIEPFLKQLKKRLPEMPVDRYDERFTSAIAHQAMIDGGVRKSERRRKELTDQTAAVIILTDWLQSRQNIEVI
ncbi:MAG: Holliday junction resolvase RuvX [Muribaculaceae bacterium]|nr:Holliday junction resolvase RuvX [Muribaculaceae bacterium]